MAVRSYSTPEAFRMALEQRIRRTSQAEGRDMSRFRQLLVFDRFLARVFTHLGNQVVAKGGLIVELRLDRARTTKDVDLGMTGDPTTTLQALREAGQLDLGDFLSFVVGPDRQHPTIQGEGMVYAGKRFRAEARLAGKLYGNSFGVDVGYADAMTVEPKSLEAQRSSTSLASSLRGSRSTRGRRTSRRSCTPTPCPATETTRASKICRTSPCSQRPAPSKQRSFAMRSSRPSSSVGRIRCPRACPSRRRGGSPCTRAWQRRTTSAGEHWPRCSRRCAISSTRSSELLKRAAPTTQRGTRVHGAGDRSVHPAPRPRFRPRAPASLTLMRSTVSPRTAIHMSPVARKSCSLARDPPRTCRLRWSASPDTGSGTGSTAGAALRSPPKTERGVALGWLEPLQEGTERALFG